MWQQLLNALTGHMPHSTEQPVNEPVGRGAMLQPVPIEDNMLDLRISTSGPRSVCTSLKDLREL